MSSQFNILVEEPRLYYAWNIVKAKGSMGGIDGITILEFEKEKRKEIPKLAEELKNGTWKPQPYLEIEVSKTKNPEEMRSLGMSSIRDKIVQQVIKSIIEPRFEKIFLGNSYGYRPGKGAVKAIRRLLAECHKTQYNYVLRLDIDNFFDTIDHDILQKRLLASGTDIEIVRLIMLCVQMGKVNQNSRRWREAEIGTPQGSVLSPIISNLYLHSFDQFAVSRGVPYIRYADDFLFLCETKERAEDILQRTDMHLKEKLKLRLNEPPVIVNLEDSFDFLGLTIQNRQLTLSDRKRADICEKINTLEFGIDGFPRKSTNTWDGITNYYAKLLPQKDLEHFDSLLVQRLTAIIQQDFVLFGSKTNVRFALGKVSFLSQQYQRQKQQFVSDIMAEFVDQKLKDKQAINADLNRKLIQERKREYRRKEVESSGLLINRPGMFVGLRTRGVTVSDKGKVIAQQHPDNLSQIVITGSGVSLSSNLAGYCMSHNIPIDFFDNKGMHLGSIVSSQFLQNTFWRKQALADIVLKHNFHSCSKQLP